MNARPRIVLVITRLIVGGAQLTVRGLCNDLSDHFDIHVVCGPDVGSEGSLLGEVREVVPVTVLPNLRRDIHPRQDLAAMASLKAIFERLRPDLVHTHSSKAGILGRLAARGRRPIVHTVHGWGHTPLDPTWRRHTFIALERFVAPRTDALVAVSEDVREEGLRLRIGTRDQYRVIPAYVDYHPSADDFTAARRRARERLEVSPDDAVIGWVGRFVPQKDPDTLAHALRRILLHRQDDHTRAVLVGDGPLRDRVQRQLAPLGSRALFTGRLANVRELYPAFDVLVHVSRWEGQPMVVEEAIAERIPVVATRVSGIEDLVRDGVGYVVGPGSVRGLADRALEVLAGSELRAPLSTEAVGQVAEGHDRAVTIAEHVRLYEELLRAWT